MHKNKKLYFFGGSTLLTSPYTHYQYTQPHHLISPRGSYGFQQIFYWPYTSPPVSPSTYYGPGAIPGQLTPNNAILAQDCGIGALTLNCPKSIPQQGHIMNQHERYDNIQMQNTRPDFIERISDKHRGLLHPSNKNYMELGLFMA